MPYMLADGTWAKLKGAAGGGGQQLEVYDVSSACRRPRTGRRVASSICVAERDAPGGFLAYRSTEHSG